MVLLTEDEYLEMINALSISIECMDLHNTFLERGQGFTLDQEKLEKLKNKMNFRFFFRCSKNPIREAKRIFEELEINGVASEKLEFEFFNHVKKCDDCTGSGCDNRDEKRPCGNCDGLGVILL